MKIVIFDIDNLNNPHWGSGQAIATKEIGKRLIKKNHEVIVYCSKYPNYKNYKKDGIAYKHIGVGTSYARINNIVYLLFLPFFAFFVKADIILEHFTAPVSTCLTPLFTKIPVVGISSFFSSTKMEKKYGIKFTRFERFGAQFYKYFIPLNKQHDAKMKKLNAKIISKIIPNGVNDNYFKIKTREENYILFIGRIDVFHKGLDLLLLAYKKAERHINDDLYIIGSGPTEDVKKLKFLVDKYKLNKRVKLLTKQLGSKKDAYFKNAKFTIFPSRFEGQSLSVLESMALAKSFICFDIPEVNWLGEKTCLKVKPFSVNQLAAKIILLSKNRALRRLLGTNGRKQARAYTWDKTARQYEDFLAAILRCQTGVA